MGVITGSWGDFKLYCIYRHETPVEMVIQSGPASPFYACPKYHAENREKGELACNNRLTLIEHDNMIRHIDNLRYESEMNGVKLNLKNYEWKGKKGVYYKVLSHDGNGISIGMINKVAIAK